MSEPKALLTGLGIPESPRWHEGRLWFCNWIERQVMAVGLDGKAEVMARRDPGSHPMGYSIDRLFTAEKAAHEEAAAARDRAEAISQQETAARVRLQALQAVTAGLATAVTTDQITGVLTGQGMNLVADYGVVALLDPDGSHLLFRATSDFPVSISQAYARIPLTRAGETPVGQAALHGERITMASAEEIAARCPLVASNRALTGTSSLLAIPVRTADRTIGALGFGFRAAGPVSAEIVLVAETLAGLTGQALERARLYEEEHAAAHQLQQALLPQISADLPGAGIGVCYRPADRGRDVGGDWYDAFELPAGRIGFAVGDVVGHDLKAAVAMGRLQQLLSYVAVAGDRPAEVLQALDEASPEVTARNSPRSDTPSTTPARALSPMRAPGIRHRCWSGEATLPISTTAGRLRSASRTARDPRPSWRCRPARCSSGTPTA
jgi:hypothetical protein